LFYYSYLTVTIINGEHLALSLTRNFMFPQKNYVNRTCTNWLFY